MAGGAYELDNLVLVPAVRRMERGALLAQASRDLPDGAQLQMPYSI